MGDELRNVGGAFGMLAFPSVERHCQDHFPHYRDFGVGGCVMTAGDENKVIQIYICPTCVTGCNEYKAAQPGDGAIDPRLRSPRRPAAVRSPHGINSSMNPAPARASGSARAAPAPAASLYP